MRTTLKLGPLEIEIEASGPPAEVPGGWIIDPGDVTISHPLGPTRFYRHGWHSWAVTHWASLDSPPLDTPELYRFQSEDARIQDGVHHRGSWVGALEAPGGQALVLGAIGLDASVEATETTLSGKGLSEPVQWFLGFGDPEATLERYARLLGERFGSRAVDPGHVWCSWYSYYTNITEDDMMEVLDGLEGLPFDVVQIDDGWQRQVGDWTVNEDFPSGMTSMATTISERGYRPGLWMAPFIALEGSEILAAHPDWFIGGAEEPVVAGFNWDRKYYGLDITNPAVEKHVRDVIATAVEWGYTYLKLDFLFAAAIPGQRFSPEVGPETAYRRAVEVVRQAAGEDTYLLACGSPIVPSLGIFDGMRIGQDVAPDWEPGPKVTPIHYSAPYTRFAVSNSHARLWLSPVVAVDPDVVYFRSKSNNMTQEQIGLLADIASVCSFVATSDPPHWLTGEERQALLEYLSAPRAVQRIDRYRFTIDGREVDFEAASLDAPPSR